MAGLSNDHQVRTHDDNAFSYNHKTLVKFEDCTGAVYRIKDGISPTPLQVALLEMLQYIKDYTLF